MVLKEFEMLIIDGSLILIFFFQILEVGWLFNFDYDKYLQQKVLWKIKRIAQHWFEQQKQTYTILLNYFLGDSLLITIFLILFFFKSFETLWE